VAQHDYVIANGTGAAVRSDLNNGLAAIVSNNSGATEPATMYAYQWWADTTTGLLKLRNAANSAWVTVGTLASANLGLAALASPTFTGTVTAPTFTASTAVNIPLGSAGSPTLFFTGDTNNGLFSPGADIVALTTDGSERFRIAASGQIGLGGANYGTSGQALTSNGSGSAPTWQTPVSTSDKISEGNTEAEVVDTGSDGHFKVTTEGSERLRVDPSGRLLVGTSTAFSTSSNALIQAVNTSGGEIVIGRDFALGSGSTIGRLAFFTKPSAVAEAARIEAVADAIHSGGAPTRLVFSTTADGASSPTERMRIANDGIILVNNTDLSGARLAVQDTSTTNIVLYGYAKTASYTGNILSCQTQTASGTGFNLQVGFVNTTTKVYQVRGNGDVQNTNNSYGSISDIKLKENIVDANSQWEDLKAFQVRNYNFKEETGHQSHTQIGLVAQEVELVSPGLVSESPDRDEDGNDLGTVTKSVNYSVLYMKAVKALQEAMERIEQLETEMAAVKAQLS
jgi:hypothetical protein